MPPSKIWPTAGLVLEVSTLLTARLGRRLEEKVKEHATMPLTAKRPRPPAEPIGRTPARVGKVFRDETAHLLQPGGLLGERARRFTSARVR